MAKETKTQPVDKDAFWKGRTAYEKVLLIIGMLCGLGVAAFGALYLFEIVENGLTYAEILLGVLMAVQGLTNVKRSKAVAIISFVAAAIVFGAAVFILAM